MNHPNHQSSKTQAKMLFYNQKKKKKLRQRQRWWKKDGSDEWERGRRWSRWETTFIGRGACRHDGEAVVRGLRCGEIGVGLAVIIEDGFEHDGRAEVVRSNRLWVWVAYQTDDGFEWRDLIGDGFGWIRDWTTVALSLLFCFQFVKLYFKVIWMCKLFYTWSPLILQSNDLIFPLTKFSKHSKHSVKYFPDFL